MYIFLNVCKQILTVLLQYVKPFNRAQKKKKKKWAPAHLKKLSTKCVYKSYICNIYV